MIALKNFALIGMAIVTICVTARTEEGDVLRNLRSIEGTQANYNSNSKSFYEYYHHLKYDNHLYIYIYICN